MDSICHGQEVFRVRFNKKTSVELCFRMLRNTVCVNLALEMFLDNFAGGCSFQ